MDREDILKALGATLDPNIQIRKQAEQQLAACEKQQGFTLYCLDLALDNTVPIHIKSSAVIFFKNRVANYWSNDSEKGIKEPEKDEIKNKLITALAQSVDDNHIKSQLTLSVRNILRDGWQLNEPIYQLLNSKSEQALVFTGLLLLFEVTRSLRWSYTDRTVIDTVIAQNFPTLELLASQILNNTDTRSSEMLYLILKIFKYSTLNVLPAYFHDVNKITTWISLHLAVVQRPSPTESALENEEDITVKCFKWGFGNLQRFYSRYGSTNSKFSTPEFAEYFNTNVVPEIFKVYFPIIEKWSSGLVLSDSSLYFLIEFLERCITTSSWDLIKPHLESIIKHLVFPCLCQKNLELFESDPEEYIRRYFDVNRESKTADVAAVDFLFVLGHQKFDELPIVLSLANEVFNDYNQDPSVSNALKCEGGLRILSTVAFSLSTDSSPYKDQIEQIIDHLITPHLTGQFEFLRARSCETISIFSYNYRNKEVLLKVFQGVYSNFKQSGSLPVQIEAADALRVLITQSEVTNTLSPEVPSIMQKLLELSRSYELDLLGDVMDSFVEKFTSELEPFAHDLGRNLCDQFIRVATEFMELQNSAQKEELTDKEYQAVGLLNTMTTMTISMNKVNLEEVFQPAIKFVLNNAAISFLIEAMELLESMTLETKQISSTVWDLYKDCINSFQTFAVEYFEYYLPFLENIILYGFKNLTPNSSEVLLLTDVTKDILNSNLTSEINGSFELVEYMTFVFNQFNDLFPICLDVFKAQNLPPYSFVKLLLASVYIDPISTLQVLESKNETIRVFELWFNLSYDLDNVYGLKLQALSLLSLLSISSLPASLEGFIPQLGLKLISTMERLPEAIRRKNLTLRNGDVTEYQEKTEGVFQEDEDDEYDDEAFKDTPLDDLNIFVEFKTRLHNIQNSQPERYNIIVNSLTSDKAEVLSNLITSVN